jgi:type II secretory ATPase GspE/PulE/Tfp pilus assembly ATPase PilB-like protein
MGELKLKSIEEWVPRIKKMPQLGTLLLEKNKISEEQLTAALKQKELRPNVPLGRIFIENGDIQENDLLALFSEFLEIPYLPNLSLRSLEDNGFTMTHETYEFLYKLFPLSLLEVNEFLPYKSELLDETGNGADLEWRVYCFAGDPWLYIDIMTRIRDLSMQYTAPEYENTPLGVLKNVKRIYVYVSLAKRGEILRMIEDLKEFQYRARVRADVSATPYKNADLFWQIIDSGIQMKCSDIHIAPNNIYGGLNVRFRKDGDLEAESRFSYGSEKFPMSDYEEFANIVFNEAGMVSHEKNVMTQDGAIQHSVDGEAYDMRIASVPMFLGQKNTSPKLTIRVLYKGKMRHIERIGILPKQLEVIKRLYAKTEGLTLLAGPTSSGKTTTIYSILNCLDLSRQSCYTLENPVEYEMPNATQIQIDEKTGLTFATVLKNLLRQDPDIVFVGEMRDEESVKSVINIANTGHTVYSTIHANSAYKVPQRLTNMGFLPHQIFSSLNLVISQRLVHKNCPECLTDYYPSEYEARLLDIPQDKAYKHGGGVMPSGETCPVCGGKGYVGRVGIFEILPTSLYPEWEAYAGSAEAIKDYFTSMKDEDGEQLYPDLMGDARKKMEMGIISPKSLASVFSRLEIRE